MGLRDDDAWRRRRQRELEDAKAAEEDRAKQRASDKTGKIPSQAKVTHDDVRPLIEQIEPLMEQLNALYKQYLLGTSERLPHEKRRLIEKLMQQLLKAPRGTQAMQFKIGSLNANFLLHRDKWDRQLKELETGKIKRIVNPTKRSGRGKAS